MGPAEPHRDTEPLRGSDDDVGSVLAGRGDEAAGEEISGDDHERATPVRAFDERAQISELSGGRRVLQQHAEGSVTLPDERFRVADLDRDAERLRSGLDHCDGVRVAPGVDHEAGRRSRGREPAGHRHRLGCRRRLVEERSVRELGAGQLAHHRLEVEERFEPALRDLGLVGGVRRVPARVLEHVPLDHGGSDRAVVPEPEERGHHVVLRRHRAQHLRRLRLTERSGKVEGLVRSDRRRHRGRRQLVERREPEL